MEEKTFQIGQLYPVNRSESKHPLKKKKYIGKVTCVLKHKIKRMKHV